MWAFLSEQVRIILFGVHKDGATLATLLPKDLFSGVLVSDDAAVYRDFTHAQKCWAHLIRKAIRLTLLQPEQNAIEAGNMGFNPHAREGRDHIPESKRHMSRCFNPHAREGRDERIQYGIV